MKASGLATSLLLALSLFGCSTLRPGTPLTLYVLDATPSVVGAAGANPPPPASATRQVVGGAPTLVVNPPRAVAGYDSQRIIYLRQPYVLAYFAHSQWVDTPARMLQPLIAAAVERSGRFGAVVLMPVSATGDFRLETEIIRLQQDFLSRPSRVHVTLRATLTDMATRRIVDWRQFDAVVVAPSDDPYGGVVAANLAVGEVLEQLAAFCAAAIDSRPAETAGQRRR